MRTIGLLGGMSWESTSLYYRLLNEGARDRFGGAHSAPIVMHSFDFAPIAEMQAQGQWDALATLLTDAAIGLEGSGAELIGICANTMHKVAPQIENEITIPIVHIADATGEAIAAAGLRHVGLIGTAFTMEDTFITGRLAERFGLDVVVPGEVDRAMVHRTVYDELIRGVVTEEARAAHVQVVERLQREGAEAIVLACTEQELLIRPSDVAVPVFPTTALHVRALLAAAGAGPAAP